MICFISSSGLLTEYRLVCPVKESGTTRQWQCVCRIHSKAHSPAVADTSSFSSKATISDIVNVFMKEVYGIKLKEKHRARYQTSL